MKIIIVMPVANEEATMGKVLDEILALPYDNLYVYPVIDDYSRDRTKEIVEQYEKNNQRVKCVYYAESRGVISCYIKGYRVALEDGADFVIEMDGGGSHKPAEIPQFIEGLKEGYDCVFGSRFIKGGGIDNHPLYRRILSGGGTLLSNLVLGTKLKDMTSGFEAFSADVLTHMDFDKILSTGHMYQTEIRYYCRNYKWKEVPIQYTGGSSSLKMKSVVEALKILFLLKQNEKNVMKR